MFHDLNTAFRHATTRLFSQIWFCHTSSVQLYLVYDYDEIAYFIVR